MQLMTMPLISSSIQDNIYLGLNRKFKTTIKEINKILILSKLSVQDVNFQGKIMQFMTISCLLTLSFLDKTPVLVWY